MFWQFVFPNENKSDKGIGSHISQVMEVNGI
jgi:hypothetical protein